MGRVIAFGSLAVLGVLVIASLASLAAVLGGVEPRGYENEARRMRRYATKLRPEWLHASSAPSLESVGGRIAKGGEWVRDRVRAAVN